MKYRVRSKVTLTRLNASSTTGSRKSKLRQHMNSSSCVCTRPTRSSGSVAFMTRSRKAFVRLISGWNFCSGLAGGIARSISTCFCAGQSDGKAESRSQVDTQVEKCSGDVLAMTIPLNVTFTVSSSDYIGRVNSYICIKVSNQKRYIKLAERIEEILTRKEVANRCLRSCKISTGPSSDSPSKCWYRSIPKRLT